jgi:hypothetical protein
MIWPMRDARLWGTRLWDGFCEKHAYERHAYLHRLEKRGSLRGRRGGWSTGRLGYRVPPAAIDKYPLYLCWEETLPQALLEAWPGASPVTPSRATDRLEFRD